MSQTVFMSQDSLFAISFVLQKFLIKPSNPYGDLYQEKMLFRHSMVFKNPRYINNWLENHLKANNGGWSVSSLLIKGSDIMEKVTLNCFTLKKSQNKNKVLITDTVAAA